MNLHEMIEICLKDDNMHIFVMINALICINNYVITCINSMLSDSPMFKEVDDPKEYLNVDMTSRHPKTTQVTNPTPRSNSIIMCYKFWKVGHVKADCSKLIIVMYDSNPLPTSLN